MNESTEELAALYVLDQLAPAERAAFEARLLREPALAALVQQFETGLQHGVGALPRRELPAGTFGRIEQRLDALSAGTLARIERRLDALHAGAGQPGAAARRVTWAGFARWGIAAVIAVSLATLAVQSLRRSGSTPAIVVVGLDQDQNRFADLPLRTAAKDPDARFIQLASLAQNFWEHPSALPLKPEPDAGGGTGYALFDPGSRQGFIAVDHLPVVAATKRYHLWLRDPATNRILNAGVLPLGEMNRGLFSFALGSDDSPLSDRPELFVTVEDRTTEPVPAQPHGKVVLGRERF
ncbi:MAG TPA: anti-sigma factor [Lacunisphaera sp.]|nr:anti-sigma factor [Lacunisphaera sp.]